MIKVLRAFSYVKNCFSALTIFHFTLSLIKRGEKVK